MAYTRPASKTAGDTITLTDWNAIRDSLIAGVDVVTTKGDLLVATAADTLTRLGVGSDDATIVADSSTSSGLAWQIQPHVVLKHSTAQDPNTSEWVTLTWNTENVDTNGAHSTGTNPDRITIPSGGAGIYRVGANVGFLTNGLTGESGHYGVRVLYNGATVVGTVFDEAEMNANDLWMYIDMPSSPSVADYYQLQVWTTRNVDVSSDSKFWAQWMRRA